MALHSANWTVSAGSAYSQFEGAGPGGYLWESKATYWHLPYFNVEYLRRSAIADESQGAPYLRGRLEWWGSGNDLENGQPVSRRIDTGDARWGWGWLVPGGIGFEMGPLLVDQRHILKDPLGRRDGNFRTSHLGSYFGCTMIRQAGGWRSEAGGWFGIVGFPARESAIGELEISVTRRLDRSPWAIGLRAKSGSLQLERDAERLGPAGSTPNAVLRFRQELLDWKTFALVLGREI